MIARFVCQACLGATVVWLLFAGPLVAENDPPIRTVILSGDGAAANAQGLKAILADSGRFQVRLCEALDGISPLMLSNFDLAIVADVVTKGSDTEKALAGFVASGKGLLVSRGAFKTSDAPSAWPLAGGNKRSEPIRFLDVKMTQPKHPIVQGLDTAFRIPDSVPGGLTARNGAETIATAETSSGSVPVLAVNSRGKGRIAVLALGIDASAMQEPLYRALLVRAGEWAAAREVTPAKASRPNDNLTRALLITGGHDHDAAFYSLFKDLQELDGLPIDTAANAFKKDLRAKYDVIIMYDFTRDLDDLCKTNLRAFVESGKGVVVLHHALLNFQKWSWWSEEVVGGRYRLQSEWGHPSSGVKNDQSFFVSPVGSHPVLAGINPFHVTDEAYNKMYVSDRIKPLLTTDNPASDVNLAWVGPCQTSRVIAIQLGHGRSIFDHPTYRALIHNAIVWAAGRNDRGYGQIHQ